MGTIKAAAVLLVLTTLSGCNGSPERDPAEAGIRDPGPDRAAGSGFVRDDGVWEGGFLVSSSLRGLLPPQDQMDVPVEGVGWDWLVGDVTRGVRRGSIACDAVDLRVDGVVGVLAARADGVNAIVFEPAPAFEWPGIRVLTYPSGSGQPREVDVVIMPELWKVRGRKRALFGGMYFDQMIAHEVASALGCHDDRVVAFGACDEECPGF